MDEKQLLETYVHARSIVETEKEILKKAEAALAHAEEMITSFLEAADKKDTGMYPNLGKLSITAPRVYASCTEENKDRCFDFLRAVGRDDLIKQVVNVQSLSAYTKTLLESGQSIPDCISYYMKPSLKFTRS